MEAARPGTRGGANAPGDPGRRLQRNRRGLGALAHVSGACVAAAAATPPG